MRHPEITRKWADESQWLVVLAAKDQTEIINLASKAWDAGLAYTLFHEPDLPAGQQITAIALQPGPEAARLCSSIPLALREEVRA